MNKEMRKNGLMWSIAAL
ncbi:Protein of unknown function [Bacillus cytotoxicus]|nr:Protein of unknown function [Bacillus cytotoxicus]